MADTAADYVDRYLKLQVWKTKESTTYIAVRNYLQAGLGTQSTNAQTKLGELKRALTKLIGKPLTSIFEVNGDKYVLASVERVFEGKGAPNEVQDVLYLALLCGMVTESTLSTFADNNMGLDCNGFVANYWGMGRPTVEKPRPDYADGIKPRLIWNLAPNLQRKAADKIEVDDAAVFFEDVKYDDPNIMAQKKDGKYDPSTGSQAFHIGVVSAVTAIAGTELVDLNIAESSGGSNPTSGGDGARVRKLGKVKATVSKGLVWVPDGQNRIYFVGNKNPVTPYLPGFLAGT